jgi:hypothetical protein
MRLDPGITAASKFLRFTQMANQDFALPVKTDSGSY